MKDTDIVCPYCTTSLNVTHGKYKYVHDTSPEDSYSRSGVSGMLRTLGHIIWGLTILSAILMLITGAVVDNTLPGIISGLSGAVLVALCGTVAGALLVGFAELLEMVEEINLKIKKK